MFGQNLKIDDKEMLYEGWFKIRNFNAIFVLIKNQKYINVIYKNIKYNVMFGYYLKRYVNALVYDLL